MFSDSLQFQKTCSASFTVIEVGYLIWIDKLTGLEMEFFNYLFGKQKTPQEFLRENQLVLIRLIRELDRERNRLEQQEWKIIADIKRTSVQGQQVKVRNSHLWCLYLHSLYIWLGFGAYIIFWSNGYVVRLFFAMSKKQLIFVYWVISDNHVTILSNSDNSDMLVSVQIFFYHDLHDSVPFVKQQFKFNICIM